MKNLVEELICDKFALLCGAGISWKSGLPLAGELIEKIIKEICFEKEDESILQESLSSEEKGDEKEERPEKAKLPFEAFIEILAEETDINPLLDMFEKGEPNENHFLIAYLAAHGFIKTVVTTNFDLLIERAMKKAGIAFSSAWREDDYDKVFLNNNAAQLFKIHGSIEDRGNMRITLRAVAANKLSQERANVIKYLLSEGPHKRVLVVGYSCSDFFDIAPCIESISENRKEIIFIQHGNNGSYKKVPLETANNSFRGYPGYMVYATTGDFVNELLKRLNLQSNRLSHIRQAANWEHNVERWARSLSEVQRLTVAGRLMAGISRLESAASYFKAAIGKAEHDHRLNYRSRASLLLDYGNIHRMKANFAEALRLYDTGLSIITPGETDRDLESRYYLNKAAVYSEMGNYDGALKLLDDALIIKDAIGDIEGRGSCLKNKGVILKNRGRFREAIDALAEAIEIFLMTGSVIEAAGAYANASAAYCSAGNFESATEQIQKAKAMLGKIGNKKERLSIQILLGNQYNNLEGNFDEAIECYKKAYDDAIALDDKLTASICLTNIGAAHYRLRNYDEALKAFENSFQISSGIGDHLGELYYYLNIAPIRADQGLFQEALNILQRGLLITRRIKDKYHEAIIYLNMSDIYRRLNNPTASIEMAGKALKLTGSTGDLISRGKAHAVLGGTYFGAEDYVRSKDNYAAAIDLFKKTGQQHLLDRARKELNEIDAIGHLNITTSRNK